MPYGCSLCLRGDTTGTTHGPGAMSAQVATGGKSQIPIPMLFKVPGWNFAETGSYSMMGCAHTARMLTQFVSCSAATSLHCSSPR